MRTLLLLLLATAAARADVTLAPLFTNHAVLQHGKPIPVWGTAEPGERVLVTLGEQQISATTAADGRWLVVLEALAPSSTPSDLIVVGKNAIKVSDVLVGEVWLCAGGTAAEFSLDRAAATDAEQASAMTGLIRQFKVGPNVSAVPRQTCEGSWVVAALGNGSELSALGFLFARNLNARLNLPVGIVVCAANDTRIESWMSPAALTSDPMLSRANDAWLTAIVEHPRLQSEYQAALQAWNQESAQAKARNQKFIRPAPTPPWGPGHPATPSGVYNGMIHPLTPYPLRGVLWAPGVSAVSYPDEYALAFRTLIETWRRHFGQADLAFLWQQLPNFRAADPGGVEWAQIRKAQAEALSIPGTGQVVAIDLVDSVELQARNVRELARRFALLARAEVYGTLLDYSGPVFASATREGRNVRVKLKHAGSALIARDRPLQDFEVAGSDGKFYPATARIERETLLVSAPEVAEPMAVRYAWRNSPEGNLYNGAGLPAAPFSGKVE